MKNPELFLIVQAALAGVLMWTCFCRLVKTDMNTEREVRWAILFEGLAAGLVFAGPWMPALMPEDMHWKVGATPAGIWLVLLLAVTLVQIVTAKFWKDGRAPQAFQKASAHTGLVAAAAMLAMGLLALQPEPASAQAQAPDPGKWRQVDGDMVYLPQGAEMHCNNSTGCVGFTTEGLRALLQEAGGSCGHIPPITAPAPGGRSV